MKENVFFCLTKERANICNGKGALKFPNADFFLRLPAEDRDNFTEKTLLRISEKACAEVIYDFFNLRIKDSYLIQAISQLSGKYSLNNTESEKSDFFVQYAIIRAKERLKLARQENNEMLLQNDYARTAALIMTAECGLLDFEAENIDFFFKTDISRKRQTVARLFFEYDRRLGSAAEVCDLFYRAVLMFLGGQACHETI